jgi:hypothetical protein
MIDASAGTTPTRYLRRHEAARYVTETWGIPCTPKSLAKLAVVGGGPEFRKAGPFPLYEPVDLDAWCRVKIGPKQKATSDRLHAPGTSKIEVDSKSDLF